MSWAKIRGQETYCTNTAIMSFIDTYNAVILLSFSRRVMSIVYTALKASTATNAAISVILLQQKKQRVPTSDKRVNLGHLVKALHQPRQILSKTGQSLLNYVYSARSLDRGDNWLYCLLQLASFVTQRADLVLCVFTSAQESTTNTLKRTSTLERSSCSVLALCERIPRFNLESQDRQTCQHIRIVLPLLGGGLRDGFVCSAAYVGGGGLSTLANVSADRRGRKLYRLRHLHRPCRRQPGGRQTRLDGLLGWRVRGHSECAGRAANARSGLPIR